MRKSLALAAPLALMACTTAPAQPVIHGETPGHNCDVTHTEGFIGKPGTKDVGAAIRMATKAAILRWAPVGYMLTMDFRADRVTVWLDADRKITKISCG